MAAQVAQIIDLDAYRKSKAPAEPVAAPMRVMYFAWWTFVPVVFVPGFA